MYHDYSRTKEDHMWQINKHTKVPTFGIPF